MKQEQRVYLARYFSDIAGWHDRSGRDEPGGTANGRDSTADVYAAIADHIQSLDENDLRLVALARLTGFDDISGFSPGPRLSAAIAEIDRFAVDDPDPFLDHLVHAALDDRLDTDESPLDQFPIPELGTTVRQPAS